MMNHPKFPGISFSPTHTHPLKGGDTEITREDFITHFPLAWEKMKEEIEEEIENLPSPPPEEEREEVILSYTDDLLFLLTPKGQLEHHGHPMDPRKWDPKKKTWVTLRGNRYGL